MVDKRTRTHSKMYDKKKKTHQRTYCSLKPLCDFFFFFNQLINFSQSGLGVAIHCSKWLNEPQMLLSCISIVSTAFLYTIQTIHNHIINYIEPPCHHLHLIIIARNCQKIVDHHQRSGKKKLGLSLPLTNKCVQ